MKGVKCIKFKKLFITLALLFVPCFLLLKSTDNASALSIVNSYNQYYYSTTSIIGNPNPASDYQWSARKSLPNADGLCGDTCYITGISRISRLQVSYENITTDGNHAALHFELNLRSQNNRGADDQVYVWNDNLPNLIIDSVAFYPSNGDGVVLNKESSSLTYVITYFTDGIYANQTVTIYVDLTLSGIPANTTGVLRVNLATRDVQISAASSDYFLGFMQPATTITWVEQNPTSLIFANNLNDALLAQQIAQNEVLIQIQQEAIERDNQDREDLQNQSDSSQDSADAAADQLNNAKTGLFSVIANFVDIVIHPPASNCVIDGDMGNMDLGDIDLCQLSLPPAFSVIGTLLIIGFLIPLGYSVISTILSLLKGATQD